MNASNSGQTENLHSTHHDEIDLRQIFQNIWQLRWKISLFSVLFFSLGAVYLGISYHNQQQNAPLTYTIHLENIINERYPDGTAFKLTHLVLPQIVKKTVSDLKLTNIDDEKIKKSIQIAYYDPNITLLQKRFNELFNERKKDAEALESLQASINQQRNKKNSIKVLLSNSANIPTSQKEIFLLTLVQNWSDYFIKQGVMSEYTLEPLRIYNIENLNVIDFISYTKQMKEVLSRLIDANNRQTYLQDASLLQHYAAKLNNLDTIHFTQLTSLFSIDNKLTTRALENRLLLQNKKQVLTGIDASLKKIGKLIETSSHNQSQNTNQNEVVIEDMLLLGKKISLADTYRNFLNQKLQLEKDIAKLSTDKSNLSNQSSLLLTLHEDSKLKPENFKDYTNFAQQYINLAQKIAQKIQQYSTHFTNPEVQKLYSHNHQPIYAEPKLSLKKKIVIVLGIAFMLSLITMIILLIARSMSREAE